MFLLLKNYQSWETSTLMTLLAPHTENMLLLQLLLVTLKVVVLLEMLCLKK